MAQKIPQQRDSYWWTVLTVSWIPPWEGQNREHQDLAVQWKATQLSSPYWLRSLVTYMYVDIKDSCNSGSPQLSHNFIFSAATDINSKICHTDVWSHLPAIVFLATPSFLTAIWLVSAGFTMVIPHCSLPHLGGAISEGLVTSSLSCLTWLTLQSRLQEIYLTVCNCRVNIFLPKFSQAMSATILIHLHFTCTLKSQPHTEPHLDRVCTNVDQKALLVPEVTNQPST